MKPAQFAFHGGVSVNNLFSIGWCRPDCTFEPSNLGRNSEIIKEESGGGVDV